MHPIICLRSDALELLCRHDWSRPPDALRLLIAALAAHPDQQPLDRAAVAAWLAPSSPRRAAAIVTPEQIRVACLECGGNKRAVARKLRVSHTTLYERIRRFKLQNIGWQPPQARR
jgi:transcriptional regulator of acetoin/glycerol metabolism